MAACPCAPRSSVEAASRNRQVNQVTRVLFARYRTAADHAAADRAELERIIEPTGFFHAKAKNLMGLGQALCDRFGGRVPDTLEDLVTLPGVGRKTANLVLGDAFGKPSLTVDTHFARLARGFGWTEQTDSEKIEQDVGALLPRREWTAASHRVIWHGRRSATPAGPHAVRDRAALPVPSEYHVAIPDNEQIAFAEAPDSPADRGRITDPRVSLP